MFYFQLSMFFAFASYVHYATFMSARAYLAASQSEEDQKSRAREVIVLRLKKSSGQAGVDKFPLIAKGVGGGDPGGFVVGQHSRYQDGYRGLSWLEGVRYTFQGKIFPVTTEVINRSVVVEDGQIKYGQFEGEGEKDYIGAKPEHHGDGELIHHYWGRHLYLTGKHVFIPFSLLIEKQPSLPDVRGVNSAFEARKTS